MDEQECAALADVLAYDYRMQGDLASTYFWTFESNTAPSSTVQLGMARYRLSQTVSVFGA